MEQKKTHSSSTVKLHTFLHRNFDASQVGLDFGLFDAALLGMATLEVGMLFAFSNPKLARELCEYLNDINAGNDKAFESRQKLLDMMAKVANENG